MGACATKPKVDASNAPAPEAAPAPENKAEEKNFVVDAVVAVEDGEKLEISPEEVAGERNQSDKVKEVVIDEDKVDDLSVKRRSLSNLFKEKEGGESIEFEGPAEETETLESKETKKDTKEAEIKVPQTEVETEKCAKEPETKAPQTEVETEKCIESETQAPQAVVEIKKYVEEPVSKAPSTVVETIKHIEEAVIKVPQTEVETEKCAKEPETKAPQTEVETEKCVESETQASQAVVETKKYVEEPVSKAPSTVVETIKHIEEAEIKVPQTEVETKKCTEPETKAPQTVVETEKCIEETESKAPLTEVEPKKYIEEAEINVSRAVVELEKHTEEAEPKAPPTEVYTEKSEVPAEKIAVPDVPTTSVTILEEKVIVTPPSDVAPTRVIPEEKTSEDVRLAEKVEQPETVTLVEATPAKDESKISEQKEELISNLGKTESETPKVTEPKPTSTETSIKSAQKHDEVKVTTEEK